MSTILLSTFKGTKILDNILPNTVSKRMQTESDFINGALSILKNEIVVDTKKTPLESEEVKNFNKFKTERELYRVYNKNLLEINDIEKLKSRLNKIDEKSILNLQAMGLKELTLGNAKGMNIAYKKLQELNFERNQESSKITEFKRLINTTKASKKEILKIISAEIEEAETGLTEITAHFDLRKCNNMIADLSGAVDYAEAKIKDKKEAQARKKAEKEKSVETENTKTEAEKEKSVETEKSIVEEDSQIPSDVPGRKKSLQSRLL